MIPHWPTPASVMLKSSSLPSGEHVTSSPAPVITSSSSTLSTCAPYRYVVSPIPPTLSVPPTVSIIASGMTGGVRSFARVTFATSPHSAPGWASTVSLPCQRTLFSVLESMTTPPAACDWPYWECPWPRIAILSPRLFA
jgi:hypothetical protein